MIDGGDDGVGRPAAIDLGDAELERLAMAADPEPEIDDDAVPFGTGAVEFGLLPEWYMPAVQRVDRRPRRVVTVAVIVGALLVVNGAGLCVTYGLPEIAW